MRVRSGPQHCVLDKVTHCTVQSGQDIHAALVDILKLYVRLLVHSRVSRSETSRWIHNPHRPINGELS